MFDIGPEKLIFILIAMLIFLGPKRIPEAARSLGRSIREFRKAATGGFDGEPTDGAGPGPVP